MKTILLWIGCLSLSFCLQAQSIEEVMASVAKNNTLLQASYQLVKAQQTENNQGNSLGDLSVEYSSFYEKAGSGQGSELIATQSFDFPTHYLARNREAKLKNEALVTAWQAERRELLLETKLVCLELIFLNRSISLLTARLNSHQLLESLCRIRLENGDIDQLEFNRLKIEQMRLRNELNECLARQGEQTQRLCLLNGNQAIEFTGKDYPIVDSVQEFEQLKEELLASDLDLLSLSLESDATNQHLSVQRQAWLPSLEAGYRRNIDDQLVMNGFVIGGSIPLFSNRKNIQRAKAEAMSAKLVKESRRIEYENQLWSLFHEIQLLQSTLETYDLTLIQHSLSLLETAHEQGAMSSVEFLGQSNELYDYLKEQLQVEFRYQQLMATLYKNRL